ncbi:hypothetical protein [Moraxella marmotae]|uniref:hypothetical protein n=1 Tax=Moraxella marmotae TaxID=3344520 RepID=UPI0035F47AA4
MPLPAVIFRQQLPKIPQKTAQKSPQKPSQNAPNPIICRCQSNPPAGVFGVSAWYHQ